MVVSLNIYRKTRKVELSIPFGERIAITRQNQGLSQKELGDRAGFSQGEISKMETGHSPIGCEKAISLVNGLPVSQDAKMELMEHFFKGCAVYQYFSENPNPAA